MPRHLLYSMRLRIKLPDLIHCWFGSPGWKVLTTSAPSLTHGERVNFLISSSSIPPSIHDKSMHLFIRFLSHCCHIVTYQCCHITMLLIWLCDRRKLQKFQSVHNAAARLVTQAEKFDPMILHLTCENPTGLRSASE